MLHSSYTMGTHDSPTNIYTLSIRACGPRALGVYIKQTTCAHGITIKYALEMILKFAFLKNGIGIESEKTM